MKIRVKLLAGFLAVAVLAGVVGLFGVLQLMSMEKSINAFSNETLPTLISLHKISNNLGLLKATIRSLANPLGADDDTYYKRQIDNITNFRAAYNQGITDFEATNLLPEEAKLWKVFKDMVPTAKEYNDSIIALVDKARAAKQAVGFAPPPAPAATTGRAATLAATVAQGPAAATAQELRDAYYRQVYELTAGDQRLIYDNMLTALGNLEAYDQKAYGKDKVDAAIASATGSITIMILIAVLVFGIAIVVGLVLGNSMSRNLKKTVDKVKEIAAGDVSKRMDITSKDEFGELATSVNVCMDSINSLVGDAAMLSKAAVDGKLATRADAAKHQGDYRKIVEGVNQTLDSVIGPLNVTAKYVDDIAKGVIPPIITDNYNGDFNVIKNNLNTVVKMMSDLLKETDIIIKAAADGELDKRANADIFLGGWKQLVSGVNATITAIVDPLMVTADYVDKVAKGIIPPEITTVYKGQYNIIKTNLNAVVKMMSDLLKETDVIIKAAADGELDKRANAALFLGGWNQLVTGVNSTITNIVDPLMVTADYVDKVAKGIIPPEITTIYKGQYNIIKVNLNAVVKMMSDLLKETDVIIKAAADGELNKRANAALFLGGWNQLVTGVNETITNIVDPLMVTADYVDKVAKGIIPPEITTVYKGQYNIIKVNLNAVVKMMAELLSETDKLVKAAIAGQLSTRADADKFLGGWNKLVAGVNETLGAVIGPLNVAANYVDQIARGTIPPKITDSYNGDFNIIKNNLNTCIDAVNALVKDALMLAQAAEDGKLQTRADAAKHQGDYRKIVDGVNKTLDLVIDPIKETTDIMKHLAEGDLTVTMTGTYKGDFDVLKSALNASLDSINDILSQVTTAVDQVTAGSQQVSQASQSLSQGATEQASSLEEITSSITEVAGQTKQNTENAIQVNGLAKTARDDAEQGNTQMKDLVAAMTDINASAEEIRKIVKAIDDISFQINLLALNANVEAARAGKYGKGFAVVAEEVRNLAVRSANSVKDTTRMVDEAISNIERGNGLVDVTAKQLNSIVAGAAQVAGLAEQVSTASKEQSLGLDQVTSGLNQIDQVTQSNTASAEESASAAEELSSQSQQLKGMLGRFKLKATESGKVNNAEVLAMLRNELARQSGGKAPAHTASGPAQAGKPAKRGMPSPADLISLDDGDFGKF